MSKINRVAEAKWNIEAEELSTELGITKENFVRLKNMFHKGYENGQADLMDSMREIYDNDPCMFDTFFHIESD